MARLGKNLWRVGRLFDLAKDLPVMEVPIDHLNVWHIYKDITLREMVMHIQVVLDADLDYPIILDEDGEILDGRHRLMKAIYMKRDTIKAVRFQENPDPCRRDDDATD